EHLLRLLIPASRVFAPSMRFRAGGGQLAIQITGSTPFGDPLPPMERDAGEGRDEYQQFERLQRYRNPPVELDCEVRGHQRRDQREEDSGRPAVPGLRRPVDIFSFTAGETGW